ncbi:MAG: GNAT family N-acetyltransferase [Nocardioidaceae bacterium]|nr:GNAT family N-acetyltransferase [Nocardioidaceae bacterium]
MNPAPDPSIPHGAARLTQVLPDRWRAAGADAADVEALAALLQRHERRARGWETASGADVAARVSGLGAGARRHLLVKDDAGAVRCWVSVLDRAEGRVLLDVTIDPTLPGELADNLAAPLFDWGVRRAATVGVERGVDLTQVDSGAFADDDRQRGWLEANGFTKTRTWWQMTRPVTGDEAELDSLAPPGAGVVIRLVERAADGMPDETDLRTVHDILETSFADHFNSYAETFEEFLTRLRADPGHRWDHWWVAELTHDTGRLPEPAGALVGAALVGAVSTQAESTPGETPAGETPAGEPSPGGSYVAYLGVLQSARGRGVAKSLLNAFIADTARRGRDRVALEVDADSPTRAERLYVSMGWRTSYVTESWHRDVPATTEVTNGGDTGMSPSSAVVLPLRSTEADTTPSQ